MPGYLREPCLSPDHLAFVSEDALWIADREGRGPRRLTADGAIASAPVFSPDGRQLAFASNVEGEIQTWIVPVEGGPPRMLTREPSEAVPVTFRPSGTLIVRSGRGAAMRNWRLLWEVDPDGGPLRVLPVGVARTVDFDSDDDRVVLGRGSQNLALWKRYRGGTRGDLWIGSLGRAEFRRLVEMKSGPACPVFCAGRVWFLCDEDGVANVWSCTPEGGDLRQHTTAREYYARSLRALGTELCYARGADVWVLDAVSGVERRIDVDARPAGVQLARHFAEAPDDLQETDLAPDAHQLAATVRGKLLALDCFGAAPRRLGRTSGVRYRLPRWLGLPDEAAEPRRARELAVLSDQGGEERLEVWDVAGGALQVAVELDGVPPVRDLIPSPTRRQVALADVAGGLRLADLDAGGPPRLLFESTGGAPRDLVWSADGRYLAYVEGLSFLLTGGVLHLFEVETGRDVKLNDSELPVHSPAFDPAGRLLYVLSERTFNPVLDDVQFGASCPDATRPYAFVLSADGLSPFDPRWPDVVEAEDRRRERELDELEGQAAERAKRAPRPTAVDFEGLAERIVVFPDVEPGRYSNLTATQDGVAFLSWPRVGLLDASFGDEPDEEHLPGLVHLEVATGKRTDVLEAVQDFQVRGERTLIRQKEALFLLKTGEEPPEDPPRKGKNRGTGELDLARLRVEIVPADEWRQMYEEAWRLQRDHFWSADMAGVDWERVRERYRPLLERVATRAELSDLIWEMQGELGTSHAYEWGGDYPDTKSYPFGALGADFRWDAKSWCVERVLDGDAWHAEGASPLAAPGVNVRAGDRIVAVEGHRLDERTEPGALLANRADQWVELTVAGPATAGEPERRVSVRCLKDERPLRHRDWVKRNRAAVRAASAGRLGYLHVPDMGGPGLSEFFRAFRAESKLPGLLIDLRHNGGGFVSPLLMDMLRRRVIGWERPRHSAPESYPPDAVRGPLVALCDAWTGSDGDMFCQAFRDYELGPIVGTRTWGGVVGIDLNAALADGTVVTQPEYASWFDSVGWDVENYGVDPDVWVDFDPAAQAAGRDPQLARAIEIALAELEQEPVRLPDWAPAPSRALPD